MQDGITKFELEKVKTTVGKLKCPHCGKLYYSAEVVQGLLGVTLKCFFCGRTALEEKWQIVEVEVDGYVCPNCGEIVADSEENYSLTLWGGPEPVLICPKCLTIIRGYIHHENPMGPEIRIACGEKGGYMKVFHVSCPKAEYETGMSPMTLKRLCVDADVKNKESRVVLVYVCDNCGAQQVVKALLEDIRIWDAEAKRWWRR